MLLMLVPDDVFMEMAETCSTFGYLNKVLSRNGWDGMFYLHLLNTCCLGVRLQQEAFQVPSLEWG